MTRIFLATSYFATAVAFASYAAAQCTTEYSTECTKWDKDEKCTNFTRIKVEVCPKENSGVQIGPITKDGCYNCYEWDSAGNCLKTKKVQC